MRAASTNRAQGPFPSFRALTVDRSKKVRLVGWLIMVYIVLLMIEGALRKWVAPGLSNPLLVIRDPVLVLIYFMAFRARVFPRNNYVVSIAIIGFLSLAMSLFILSDYIMSLSLWVTVLYGFRSNFLHMPLIFLMANVFDEDDVKRIGWWMLLGMIPMALLMVAQFQASPDSFINGTAGMEEGAEQLSPAGGKIRPAGTFSFISGPIFYCSVVAAFLLHGMLSRGSYKIWLVASGGSCIGGCRWRFRQSGLRDVRAFGCCRDAHYFCASATGGQSVWPAFSHRPRCRWSLSRGCPFLRKASTFFPSVLP